MADLFLRATVSTSRRLGKTWTRRSFRTTTRTRAAGHEWTVALRSLFFLGGGRVSFAPPFSASLLSPSTTYFCLCVYNPHSLPVFCLPGVWCKEGGITTEMVTLDCFSVICRPESSAKGLLIHISWKGPSGSAIVARGLCSCRGDAVGVGSGEHESLGTAVFACRFVWRSYFSPAIGRPSSDAM